ncbi:bifunctional UDP-N-acetylmuramoyl-tripeptide:D-alanyl-D-alanine ligase/alanine racemase [Bacteroidia bacterium]|nr:bifunctional UDP-N-acetylmuramoyl-tripeptide:D-alanyl-D-alanine ligase/alanine racemase [Bacteroidia bacterium]
MTYTLQNIAAIVGGSITGDAASSICSICRISTDSRHLVSAQDTLFVALVSTRNNGHNYLPSLYAQGVRYFLVSQKIDPSKYPNAAFVQVEDSLQALQKWAKHHRQQLACPVVGITGSNGKTIVKEWITQLLLPQLNVQRSPKSYNSQLGVPLSVLSMDNDAALAVVEAGISLPNEMERLAQIICPSVAVVTNLGDAHQEGFVSRQQKLSEKLKLCAAADVIVCCADHREIYEAVKTSSALQNKEIITWGKSENASLQILQNIVNQEFTTNTLQLPNASAITYQLPFIDAASQENVLHSLAVIYALQQHYPQLGIDLTAVVQGVLALAPIVMRLDLRPGIHNCVIVNDAYSADVSSLGIALDFLTICSQHTQYAAILSDFEQSGKESWRLYGEIAALLNQKGVSQLIGIGKDIFEQRALFECPSVFYKDVDECLQKFDFASLSQMAVLIKGSRDFGLEKIAQQLEQHKHQTTLEVNLSTLKDNLNAVRDSLQPATKTLVLVKANAYGAGICEIARFLQQQRVDYLGVAFADEGVALRQAEISLPILVLNPESCTFDTMVAHRLEPEIYGLSALTQFNEALVRAGENDYPIHLKLDTGMHRLGFLPPETPALLQHLQALKKTVRVASIFSHLAAADEKKHDAFTLQQIALFEKWSSEIAQSLGYTPLRHIANSAGSVRFPQAQLDMIRLGISFYGINVYPNKTFRPACTLKSRLVQTKTIAAGESIGYGRKGMPATDTRIGLVPIGYADGLNRLLSNGVGKVLINNKLTPIIGNICMDMCMIDLTGIPAQEGDEVIIFGQNPSIEQVAQQLHTIPYEVLARISPRVKRVYFYE